MSDSKSEHILQDFARSLCFFWRCNIFLAYVSWIQKKQFLLLTESATAEKSVIIAESQEKVCKGCHLL